MQYLESQTVAVGLVKKKKRKKFIFFVFLMGLSLTLTHYYSDRIFNQWLGFSWLQIESLEITCDWPLTSDQVLKWLPPLKGKNILSASSPKLAALLEEKPWVKSVTIKKTFPPGIKISIETKQPFALEKSDENLFSGFYFVDDKGDKIARAETSLLKGRDFPIISWKSKVSHYEWNRKQVVEILSRLRERFSKEAKSSFEVSEVRFGLYPEMSVFLTLPRTELVLDALTWEAQFEKLLFLLQHPAQNGTPPKKIFWLSSKKAVVSYQDSQ
jgi:cell division septal protein FtsQ